MLASKIETRPDSAEFGHTLQLVPSPIRGMPLMCQAMSKNAYGFGTEMDFRSILLARYENVERAIGERPSYYPTALKSLGQYLDQGFAIAVRKCFEQTRQCSKDNLDAHKFSTTECLEITTGRIVEVPVIFTNLHWLENDSVFFPIKDTGGTACHTSHMACYENALLEFVERQCLLTNWLLKKPISQVTLAPETNGMIKISGIIEYLSSAGIVRVLDISMPFSANTFLSIFTSADCKHPVKFACGLACSLNARAALEKSVIELFQGYYHMHSMTLDPPEEVDYLSFEYFRANQQETGNLFGSSSELNFVDFLKKPNYSLNELIASISQISRNVAYFQSLHEIDGQTFFLGRVFSPDMFVQMAVHRNCNLDNELTRQMNINIPKPVPPLPFG